MSKKAWFKALANNSENSAKITIDGEIGYDWWDGSGKSSSRFMNEVNALGELELIEIDLNSPGGSVTDGLAIANYLRNHSAKVVINVLGQASSIASVIACAADEVHMGLGSFMFLHKASSGLWGNADQMKAVSDDLATIDEGILEVYIDRAGEANRQEIIDLIAGHDGNGTAISAARAKELGLADTVVEAKAAASAGLDASASFSSLVACLQRGRTQAEALIQQANIDPEEPQHSASALVIEANSEQASALASALGVEVEALEEGGVEALMAHLKEGGASPDVTASSIQQDHPEVYEEIQNSGAEAATTTATNAERDRTLSIVRAAKTAGQFGPVEKLIQDNWDADKAADMILASAAAADPNLNTSHSPDGGQQAVVSTSGIYARRKSKATN